MNRKYFLPIVLLSFFVLCNAATPKSLDYWTQSNEASTEIIDHSAFENFLATYVVKSSDNINLVNYKNVTNKEKTNLAEYIHYLENIKITNYSKAEQFPYWINLYNAVTIQLIINNYPVTSIKKIKASFGLFSSGPWDDQLVVVEGNELSLNDIEHRILRPIFKDKRIHYAVNCASLGCPNIQEEVFTSSNLENQLDKAAREYINHNRGVEILNGKLYLSSIYKWYDEDFGSKEELIKHLSFYADPILATKLAEPFKQIKYRYNWDLNEL